jgi:small basic protein (TIGR04137 family)
MSTDKSLKSKDTLGRHRNVLTRTERIEVMKDTDRWTEEKSAFGLPKIGHRKVTVGKKSKDKKADGEGEGDKKGDKK